MADKQSNPRALAVEVLVKVAKGAYSNIELKNVISRSQLSQLDINLLTEIVYGVMQKRLTLEYDLAPFIEGKKVQPWVYELLLSAIFQMVYLDRVPTRAIFNESIEIAKIKGHKGIRLFVTGVLHAMQRKGFPELTAIQDETKRRSITYSVAPWIIKTLDQQVGRPKTDAILTSINHPAHQTIRVNTQKASVAQILEDLQQLGFEAQPSAIAADGIRVAGGNVAGTDVFKSGAVTIQDESAMLVGEALQLESGMHVLDACAAPGGKTTQIAQYVGETGSVLALDLHPKKVALIEANAKRMGLEHQVTTKALDARQIDTVAQDGEFDRILVDAPCSGIGLMRRKPEIRYEKHLVDSQNLHKIQLAILNAVATKLKKNGIMIYSTCTILQQENEETVAAFLAQHPEFELVTTETKKHLKASRAKRYLNIYPDDFDSDGFFIACLKKRA
ncbi:16S rRNA (cytosine(967)-C(5))-methyltransferase RsmB [Pediococcus siamensis]|uniref:16S rRNA (cytosine(967)-C(5))-methyltransferase RsmB n=1 Tax=Pediococcus siamensis TaxID=381829 RepID=UPI00399F6DD3